MADETSPFENVQGDEKSFRLPRRKWRELLFVGALVADGDLFVRDSSRPLPPLRKPNLFPEGKRFRARLDGDWVSIERVEE
ncbi:MAG TPA: hypothetical protein VEK15_21755 [Vicinamibacteria bacterium]|nr:hypothetical protein [Vicinamibacteria bacterium]